MNVFLGDEWFAEMQRRSAELPEVDGADADLEVAVGGRSGVRVRLVVESGRVTSVEADPAEEAPLQLACPASVARDLLLGDVTVAVAFMRGQLKVNGDMAAMHRLLPHTSSESFEQFLAELAAGTEFV